MSCIPTRSPRSNRVQAPLTGGSATIVVDANGRVISQLPSGPAAVPNLPPVATLRAELGRPFTVTGSNGVHRFRAIAGDLGGGRTIVFATPLTDVNGTVNDLTHVALIVGGIAVALLALLMWRLLAAAARPIDSMIDVATRIGDGDFSARVEADDVQGDAARLAAALNQMVARIEAAFAETSASEARLRRFVADASHELRTPLTSIRGYAQLCRMGAAGDDAENAIVRIDNEAKRMSVLVDDLLLLARLDQGRPQSRELVDIAALAREVAEEAKMLEPDRPFECAVPARTGARARRRDRTAPRVHESRRQRANPYGHRRRLLHHGAALGRRRDGDRRRPRPGNGRGRRRPRLRPVRAR